MMICVQLDMKEEFDRIWKWAKTYMWMSEGENEGYFAWSCATDGKKNAYGPAPDGEEFFAMALLFASHRWGTAREYSTTRRKPAIYFMHVYIRVRTEDWVSLCGTERIIRYFSFRGWILPTHHITFRIFMSYSHCGLMRRTELSLRRQLRQAVSIL